MQAERPLFQGSCPAVPHCLPDAVRAHACRVVDAEHHLFRRLDGTQISRRVTTLYISQNVPENPVRRSILLSGTNSTSFRNTFDLRTHPDWRVVEAFSFNAHSIPPQINSTPFLASGHRLLMSCRTGVGFTTVSW